MSSSLVAFSATALYESLSRVVPDPGVLSYCIAFSGGVDSTALLCAAAQLRDAHPKLRLRALHVNHHLQAGADAWAAHCARIAEQFAVPFRALDIQVRTGPGISTEAAAREGRYAALAGELKKNEALLTAHTRNDQVETLLLQLLRGAGVAGLAAMPLKAAFGPGLHLRPLLGFTRSDLEVFLEAVSSAGGARIAWVEDPSNTDERYDRNYLRRRILPLLSERWPGAVVNMARTASHLAEAQLLLDELGRRDLRRIRNGEALSVESLRELDGPCARNLLRYWFREAGVRPPSTVKLQEILRQMLHAREDAHPCVEWEGAKVSRRRGRIYLQRP